MCGGGYERSIPLPECRRGRSRVYYSLPRTQLAVLCYGASASNRRRPQCHGGAYLVTGGYDLVVVTEVPNSETVAKMALGTAMQGNVRTMTLRAFGREEMDKIIGSLP